MASKKRAAPASIATRAVLALAAIGVVYFAVQGGEWGTFDLVRQRTRLARVHHELDSLKHELDSLKKYKAMVESDPVTQERIAREEFGMVKGNKELLYRFTEPAPGDTPKKVRKP